MAEGYKEVEHVETYTPELLNNFSKYASWSSITVYRCGKMVLISGSGLIRNVDTTSDTKLIDLPFRVAGAVVTGPVQDNASSPIIIASSNYVQVNRLPANKYFFFSLTTVLQ